MDEPFSEVELFVWLCKLNTAQGDIFEGVSLHLDILDRCIMAGGRKVSIPTKAIYYLTFLTLGIKHLKGGEPFNSHELPGSPDVPDFQEALPVVLGTDFVG